MARRPVWTTNLAALAVGLSMFGSFILIPQFVQAPAKAGYGFGASITVSGIYLLPWALLMLVAGPLCGRLRRALRVAPAARPGRVFSRLSYSWLAALPRRAGGHLRRQRPARPRDRACARGDGQPRRRGRPAGSDRRRQRHQHHHAHDRRRRRRPGGGRDPQRRRSPTARAPGRVGLHRRLPLERASALGSSRCSCRFAIPSRSAGARARGWPVPGADARVSGDGRLTPEVTRRRHRGDRRRDHVDPRHDDRQRRARDAVARARRAAVDDPVGLDRLPARAGHGHPAHRLGGRALRPQARVDEGRRAPSSPRARCAARPGAPSR